MLFPAPLGPQEAKAKAHRASGDNSFTTTSSSFLRIRTSKCRPSGVRLIIRPLSSMNYTVLPVLLCSRRAFAVAIFPASSTRWARCIRLAGSPTLSSDHSTNGIRRHYPPMSKMTSSEEIIEICAKLVST